MNCILFQKFRISEMLHFCILVLACLTGFRADSPEAGQQRLCLSFLEVSEQDWTKLWAGSALGSAFQLGLGDPSAPFQPELSHGPAVVPCPSSVRFVNWNLGFELLWVAVVLSFVISPNQCRSCAVRKVGLDTVIANLPKLKRKRLIFCAISDGLCVLF